MFTNEIYFLISERIGRQNGGGRRNTRRHQGPRRRVPRILDDDGRERRGGRRRCATGSGETPTAILYKQQYASGDGESKSPIKTKKTKRSLTSGRYSSSTSEFTSRYKVRQLRGNNITIRRRGRRLWITKIINWFKSRQSGQ